MSGFTVYKTQHNLGSYIYFIYFHLRGARIYTRTRASCTYPSSVRTNWLPTIRSTREPQNGARHIQPVSAWAMNRSISITCFACNPVAGEADALRPA